MSESIEQILEHEAEPEPPPPPLRIVGIERPVRVSALDGLRALRMGDVADVLSLEDGELVGMCSGQAVRLTNSAGLKRPRYELGKAIWA